MYNLTVDEAHTFFVGDGQWLVHNIDCIRFANADDPSTLLPNMLKYDSGYNSVDDWIEDLRQKAINDRYPNIEHAVQDQIQTRANYHARGFTMDYTGGGLTVHSPFVSVGLDIEALIQSDDIALAAIIWGTKHDTLRAATHIGYFQVPSNRLITPRVGFAAIGETERLFLGGDLASFLIRWDNNPYPNMPLPNYLINAGLSR